MKLNKVNKQQATNLRYKKIEEELTGYWKSDQWDL